MPPLFRMAVRSGTPATVALHIARGVLLDSRDSAGRTALMLAASEGRVEICRLLLDGGADPALIDADGQTALELARDRGRDAVVDILTPAADEEPWANPFADDAPGEIWEAEDDVGFRIGDAEAVTQAAALQDRISGHVPDSGDEDWADIVIDIPATGPRPSRGSAQTRSAIRFRSLRGPRRTVPTLDEHSRQRIEDTVVALDLSQSPEAILGTFTLADIIRGTDASIELRRCIRRTPLFDMTAVDFLTDDDGEARFCAAPGVTLDDYFELSDVVNAFTVLVHRHAGGTEVAPLAAAGATPAVAAPILPATAAASGRSPEETLASTSLAALVLNSKASPQLCAAITRSKVFEISLMDFLVADDIETDFSRDPRLGTRLYLELADLVNAYTTVLHREASGR